MAKWIFVTIVSCLIGGLQAQTTTTDYCANSYCRNSLLVNIGCKPPASPGGAGCNGLSPEVVSLNTTALQSLILAEHNSRRSQLALGKIKSPLESVPFPTAIRMPTLTWDDELAKQAGNNARNCTYKHDSCRNTAVYAYAGQNLALTQFYGMNMTTEKIISDSINSWWSEYNVTTFDQLKKYPSTSPSQPIGHFTQMASDRSNKMGCAMQRWKSGVWITYYFVCDYAVTNIVGYPTYKNGTMNCATGINPTYPGLCSTAEVVQPIPVA